MSSAKCSSQTRMSLATKMLPRRKITMKSWVITSDKKQKTLDIQGFLRYDL